MARRSGISQEELRRRNVSALLSRVHTSGPTSRAALTAELGLNRSTIGDLTGLLVELGLVREEVPGAGRRSGRPSLVVSPREDVTVLAVELDVDRIRVALVGLGGVVLQQRRRTHQPANHDVASFVESVAQMSRELLAMPEAARCLGVGVSIPGAVRATDGMVHVAPNLGWRDAPFTELLAAELGMEVTADNDANLGVLAEHIRGAAIGFNDVAFLAGSVGIGGGFLLGGVPMAGADGFAGEIGHVLVDSNGGDCRCGSVGCWETKVGDNQLLRAAGRLPGGGHSAVAEVIASADEGDRRCAEAVDTAATWMGVGIRPVVNLFNPSVIVLSGLLAQLWVAREPLVREALERGAVIPQLDRLDIKPAALAESSSLMGAAELAFAPLLADPLGVAGLPVAVSDGVATR